MQKTVFLQALQDRRRKEKDSLKLKGSMERRTVRIGRKPAEEIGTS